MVQIKDAYGDAIELQRDYRHVIDALFFESSWIVRAQFFIFALGFFLPFLIQLFYTRSAAGVIICNVLCAITQFLLVCVEIVQIKLQGIKAYLCRFWNIVDLVLIALFTLYFILRWADPTKEIIPDTHAAHVAQNKMTNSEMTMWFVLNTFLLISAVMKLMFFLRINQTFGMMV